MKTRKQSNLEIIIAISIFVMFLTIYFMVFEGEKHNSSIFYITCGAFIIIAVIVMVYSIFERRRIIELENEIEDYLIEIDYIDRAELLLRELFGNDDFHRQLKVSDRLVNNFASAKLFEYLVKYFDFVINDETYDNLYKFKKLIDQVIEKIGNDDLAYEIASDIFPSFKMYYVSPQGRSRLSHTFVLNENGVIKLIRYVNAINKKTNTTYNERKKLTKELRQAVLKRDNFTCCKCGNSIYKEPNLLLEVDHIVPISKGGKTELKNLQTLCWKCNREKSDKIDIDVDDFNFQSKP